MSEIDPEKRGFARLQKVDRAKAARAPSPHQDDAPSGRADDTAPPRRPAAPLAPRGTPAANVDTDPASNVDTSVPQGANAPANGSNVDTGQGRGGNGSNVDTQGADLGSAPELDAFNVDTGGELDGASAGKGSSTTDGKDAVEVKLDIDDAPVPTKGKHQVFAPYVPKATRPAAAKQPTFDELKRKAIETLAPLAAPRETVVLGSAPGTTRTEDTRKQYDKRGRQLEDRYHREKEIAPGSPLAPIEFALWFLSLRPNLKASSWRFYKQAAIFHLSRIQSSDAEEAVAIIERETSWDSEMDLSGNRATPSKKTKSKGKVVVSATKAQFFEFEDWVRLDAYLRMRVWSKYCPILRNWLRAGLATGLRPDEWRSTMIQEYHGIDGDKVYLFVMNAKHTNGRANGKMRSIDITDFSDDTMFAVEQMSQMGASWQREGIYDSVQNQVSQTLYRADNTLWPNRRSTTYALYSCRHQFVLNHRKSLEANEADLSAMLGHMVTETQLTKYGKRNQGWSPDKIIDVAKAHSSESATVRKTLDQVEIRRNLDALINIKQKPSRTARVLSYEEDDEMIGVDGDAAGFGEI